MNIFQCSQFSFAIYIVYQNLIFLSIWWKSHQLIKIFKIDEIVWRFEWSSSWKSILKNRKLWLELEKLQKVIERFFTFSVHHENVFPLWCCVFKILFLFESLKLEVRTEKKKWNCWQQTQSAELCDVLSHPVHKNTF